MRTLLLFFDESQNVLPSADTALEDADLLPTVRLAQTGRKYLTNGVYALQSPITVNRAFLRAAGQLFLFRFPTKQEQEAVRDLLDLNAEQFAYYKEMKNRQALYRAPALGIPTVPLTIAVWPEMRVKVNLTLWNARACKLDQTLSPLFRQEGTKSQPREVPKTEEYKCLAFIATHYFRPLSWYYKAMAEEGLFGTSKAGEIIKELEKDFLKIHDIPTGKRLIKVPEITELAFDRFQLKKTFRVFRGAGFTHNAVGFWVHDWWQNKGYTVKREAPIGTTGHYADIIAQRGKEITITEIACGNAVPAEANNLRSDLTMADRIEVVGNDREHLSKLAKELGPNFKDRVRYRLFYEFLPTQASKKAPKSPKEGR